MFTYSLPQAMEDKIQIGCRVIVPFGSKKFYTGIVYNIHCNTPQDYETKEITTILDNKPIIIPKQLKFWEWIASYYLCTLGDVFKASLPSGLKLESETIIEYNSDFELQETLNEKEILIVTLLGKDKEKSVTLLEKESNISNILPIIKSLLDKGVIFIKEEIKRSYQPKLEIRVRLQTNAQNELFLQDAFNKLSNAPKQLALLMKYIELSQFINSKTVKEVSKKELIRQSGASIPAFNELVNKHIFETYSFEIGRLSKEIKSVCELNPLSDSQQKAYNEVQQNFTQKNVCLLHGVTSSGKTEIYIHLINDTIKRGKQVLYLLPEIALTTQITERLKRVFGNRLGIYHSKFSDAERVEIWQKQLSNDGYDVILGVRSSIFLPFQKLGLVIVDEEHENTYKQYDPAPRYHARNAAIVLASFYNAKTLLGTATPAVETYYNAQNGKYGLVELNERYKEIKMPNILPIDIKELSRKKRMYGPFSATLLEHIRGALEHKEQVILFQNRRGFAPMIECKTCGWVPKCKNCDVSLTYHKGINQLTCHYCGYTYQIPRSCPACESIELINRGFGTEKIEDDIKKLFPEVTAARLDLDTTRTRTAYEKIIANFEEGKTDILIGTQMVSKGLDFDHVSVVGILNSDTMLNYPDFRSYERAYQLMAQVAGRAGRKKKQGTVILQTKSINHPIIHQIIRNDYLQMYTDQLSERQLFRYPPYYRLIYVYLKNRKANIVETVAHVMAEKLRTIFGNRILGPDNPPIARIQSLYIKKIVVKIENNASIERARALLIQVQKEITQDERFKSIIVYYDVDPL